MPELTDTEKAMLDLAGRRWKYSGARDTAIREQFDMSHWRFAQAVDALIDRPEALAYDAPLVNRLRRLREERRRVRRGR